MLYGTSGEPQYIKAYHRCYDPLLYPLFFLVVRMVGTKKYCMQNKAISLKICVFLCVCDTVYRSFFSQLVPKQYLMFQLIKMSILARTKLRRKGTKVIFRRHISVVFLCLWIFIYANSVFLLVMPDGDAMEDIIDKFGEDEIMAKSGKLFFFLQYLDKQ
jgi:hypothetical protein